MVHAVLPDGSRVIRRDNSSKWFIQHPDGKFENVKLDKAVEVALTGKVRLNVYGGTVFDSRIRKAAAARKA